MYDQGFKKAALALYGYFGSMKRTAQALKVGIGTVFRWHHNGVVPKARQPCSLPDRLLAVIKDVVLQRCHLTQQEVAQHLHDLLGIKLSRRCVSTALRKLGITRKRIRKRGYTDPERLRRLRTEFRRAYGALAPDVLVASVDEVGFDHRMLPVYGYAPKGAKAVACFRARRCARINAIVAITRTGQQASQLIRGAVDGAAFARFVDACPWPAGTVLLMDNTPVHRNPAVRAALAARGYSVLYVPPYSPDCNPIENVFSVVKHRYRKQVAELQHGQDVQEEMVRACLAQPGAASYDACFRRMERHLLDLAAADAASSTSQQTSLLV